MQQVGYDPLTIHSTLQTEAYNGVKHNAPSYGVPVSDAITNFKIYTLQWAVDKLEIFVGYEANPFQTRILVWTKSGDWASWYIFCFKISCLIFSFLLGHLINHFFSDLISLLVVHGM